YGTFFIFSERSKGLQSPQETFAFATYPRRPLCPSGAGTIARSPIPVSNKRPPSPEQDFWYRESGKAAGASQPRRRTHTGPASPRRSVCAPDAVAFSFYRRPGGSAMKYTSWLRGLRLAQELFRPRTRSSKALRAKDRRVRIGTERLEDRTVPVIGASAFA